MFGCPQSNLQPEPVQPQPLHILMVEDVSADAELVSLTLQTANINSVCEVTDTLQGLERLLQEQVWDVVLADYRLKGFTAYQVLEVLHRSPQQIPFILVTGSLGEEAAVDCIKAGMTDYVLKDRLFRLPMVLERSLREFELKRQQQASTQQLQQQARREAIINQIVKAMRETLVLDEVLQTTVDMLHDTLQVKRCLIMRLAPQTNQMTVHQVSEATVDRAAIQGEQCLTFEFFKTELTQGQSVCLPDVAQLPADRLKEQAVQLQIGAMLMVPLRYQQVFLGSICLHHGHSYTWTAEEVSMVEAIAAQCAIAIHQAQLFDQVQHQARQEQLLNQIGQVLNSSLDPGFILQEIVRLTGECFRVDRALIFAIEQHQIQIQTEWLAKEQVPSMQGFTASVADWFDVITQPISAATGYVLHVPDYRTLPINPGRQEILDHRQTQSLLSVPIFVQDQFFGGLELHTTEVHRTFQDDEIHLLQRIADQAAIALYNAQSYERLEQLVRARTRELEEEKFLSDAANRAKSEFLANMSHELRTPLTGILGFSSVLLKQIFGSLNEKQEQYIESIASCGEHLLSLINDLLDLTKIEAGREELVLEPIEVREFCEACLGLIRERAEEHGLQTHLDIASDVEIINADRRRLKQILFNLLSNAVKFTEQGSVTLKVVHSQEQAEDSHLTNQPVDTEQTLPTTATLVKANTTSTVQFQVIDTGIGIAEADVALLFQPFQQLDSGLDRRFQGTGLGLALARKLAQLHGGEITVQSDLGRGSCFTLHIPHREEVTIL